MKIKEYKSNEIVYQGNSILCPECNSKLTFIKGLANMWNLYYHCDNCNKNFNYIPSDMGQTLPYFAMIDEIPK